MKPSVPPLLVFCLVMSLNSYTQQAPHCLPLLGCENMTFICNVSSLREFPTSFPTGTTFISIQSTQISSLGADALQGLPELQMLFLSNNQLKTLPSGLFRNLPRLNSLDVSGNLLEDLDPELFANAGSLTHLSLSKNQLAELHPSWFKTLEELKILHLNHNQMKEILTSCFRKLTQLLSLDLSFNLLCCLSPEMFRGLTSLTNLNLNNNPIQSIAPQTFHGTPRLRILSHTSLSHVPAGLFQSLKNVGRLDLSANEITSLDSPLVNGSSLGFTLNLSGNPWACDCRLQALLNWVQKHNVDLFPKEDVVCTFPKSLKGQVATSLNGSQLCSC
ncbi:phospholipase A2 inhibitor-like [Erythrolamprus reginae]|uniref:phospholipase A2 inhibitor-like n=1 Tax=Erythrolamprus reginae TaxID=121349 RepID=UPI00396CE491